MGGNIAVQDTDGRTHENADDDRQMNPTVQPGRPAAVKTRGQAIFHHCDCLRIFVSGSGSSEVL